MTFVHAVCALAAIWTWGAALSRLALGGGTSFVLRVLHASVTLLLGLAVWSAGYSVVLLSIGLSPSALLLKDIVLAVCGALAYAAVQRYAAPPLAGRSSARTSGVTRTLAITFALALLAIAVAWALRWQSVPDGDWDAWMIWNMRARFFVRAPDDTARAFSSSLGFSHPDYPLLVPGLVANGWSLLGRDPPWLPAVVSGLLPLAAYLVMAAGMTAARSPLVGATAGLVLVSAPFYVMQGAAQCADIPLGSYALLSGMLLVLATGAPPARRAGLFVVAGFAASAAAWTKNEGLLFFLALSVSALAPSSSTADDSRVGRARWWLMGALPLLGLLAWFKLTLPVQNDLVAASSVEGIWARTTDGARYVQIAQAFALELLRVSKWNLVPIALPLAVFIVRRGAPPRDAWPLLLALLLVGVGFSTVYVLTPRDLSWHLTTSLERLLAQWWPLAVLTGMLWLAPRSLDPSSAR